MGGEGDYLTIAAVSSFVDIGSGVSYTVDCVQYTNKLEKRAEQRKRLEDNIREWTGPEFGRSQRAVENGEKWRKLVARSSVVPQRLSRLRD